MRAPRKKAVGSWGLVHWATLVASTVLASSQIAATQYDLVVLAHGPGTGSVASGVDNGHAVGEEGSLANFQETPVWWPTPSNLVGLTVLPSYSSPNAYAIRGNQITGDAFHDWTHAMLWTVGMSGSVAVDLQPAGALASSAASTDGVYQVGTVILNGTAGNLPSFAALWRSSADSVVNLSPGFYNADAAAVADGIQVGSGRQTQYSNSHALLWRGTAASVVDLNPPTAESSQAAGISHGQIVGTAYNDLGAHAVLWTSPNYKSAVDLNPSSQVSSQLTSTNGAQQVGTVTLVGGQTIAEVWTGTAASASFLPDPAGYTSTAANGIDLDGDIVGQATGGNPQHPNVGVMWVPHRLLGDANFDGKVDFSDLITLARNYGRNGDVGFVDGNFNMDGSVGFDDLVILARNYGVTAPTSSQLTQLDPSFRADVERAFADVPEPSSLAPLALATLVRRRRL